MKKLILIGLIILNNTSTVLVFGQESKIDPRISMSYFKSGDDVPTIKIKVKKRVERRYYPVQAVMASVYINKVIDRYKIGDLTTDDNGEGAVQMPENLMDIWHRMDTLEFIAVMAETDSTNSSEENLTIYKSRLSIQASQDSTLTATLEQKSDSGWMHVEGVQVKFFIKTDFGKLFLSDDYMETDEQGSISLAFDKIINGDKEGKLTIGAMVEDHDDFGNIFEYKLVKWGLPQVEASNPFEERNLWSTRDKTPIWLLLLANAFFISVWGVIIYLVIQLRKLTKAKIN